MSTAERHEGWSASARLRYLVTVPAGEVLGLAEAHPERFAAAARIAGADASLIETDRGTHPIHEEVFSSGELWRWFAGVLARP